MSNPRHVDKGRQQSFCLLRRRDQQFLAALAVLAGLSLLGWWWHSGGLAGRLIEWGHAPTRAAHFEVNVNTANWPELTQLPEIGETLARRIVTNRGADGPYRSPDDLTRVHGIGEKTLDQMRPHLSSEAWGHQVSPAMSGMP